MKKQKIGKFFNKDEIVLYKSINDLSSKIIKYNDNKLRCKITARKENTSNTLTQQ